MKIEEILKKVLEIPDLVLKKHEHSNKSIIDKITQIFLDNWNSAYNHISDNIKHITSSERTNWNDADSKKHTHVNKNILDKINQSLLDIWSDKYTKNEIDNKISQVITDLDWKESVNTFSDISKTYPNPHDGWTVNVRDNNITYRYDGSKWIDISSNSIPLATSSLDGRMSKNDKAKLDGIDANANNYAHPITHSASMIVEDSSHRFMTDTERNNLNDCNSKKHTHDNKSIIDKITQALLDNWNSAFSHVSDTVKHITSNERNLWNTVSNKSDKDHIHDDRYYTESEINSKITTINNSINTKANSVHTHNKSNITDFPTSLPANGGTSSFIGNAYQVLDYNTFNPSSVALILKDQGNVMPIKAQSNANSPWENTTSGFLFQSNGIDSYHIIIFRSGGDGYAYRSCYQNKWGNWKLVSFDGHNHNYNDLSNKPTIPSKTSQLTNDAGYITQSDVDTSQNHVHSNKGVLDKINQALLDSWNTIGNKSDKSYVDGELNKKANSSHMHSIDRKSANDLPATWPIGLYMSEVYNNGFPCSYGNCLTMKSSSSAITQICIEWSGSDATIGSMWIRNKRDTGIDKFSEWRKFSFTDHTHNYNDLSNKPNIPSKLSQLSKDINFDDRYYTESEINTKLAEKSNNNHTHNYAGSSSVGGSADTAVKLATARNINGVAFDGSSNITVIDSTKLPITGGTVTGKTLFNQGISVKNINGGAGTSGYMHLAQIKITGNYQNQPITFNIHQRERFGTIIIKFNSQNSSDPTLAYINKIGSSEFNAYICKSATSTWDLYLQKSEGYDSIDIIGFSKGDYMSSTLITWQSSTVTSLPSGCTTASVGFLDMAVTKANQDSDGKQINTTYVKKGMTWNELEGV